MWWCLILASLSLLACAQKVELKGGQTRCFYDSLSEGDNWGVQFQAEDGDFKVEVLNFAFSVDSDSNWHCLHG